MATGIHLFFLQWEMGFEELGLGFCQFKTATGNGILSKLECKMEFGKKKTWAGKWDVYPPFRTLLQKTVLANDVHQWRQQMKDSKKTDKFDQQETITVNGLS